MKTKAFVFFFCLLIFCQFLNAMILNDSIPAGKNYEKALFRLWFPNDLETIKGIVILVPGSNSDGRDQVLDPEWQAFAKKHGFALLACFYKDYASKFSFVEQYVNVSQGSGQALLDVINKFSVTSGHTELTYSPLLLWGVSAGGQFNYEFTCWQPGRVIAFVVNKGGIYYTALAPVETRNVPGIFFVGEKDIEARNDIIKGLFSMNRRAGALWVYAPEPEAAHDFAQSKKYALKYFDEIVPLRMPENEQDDTTIILKPLNVADGLIGDHKNKVVLPVSDVKKFNYPVSWFPRGKSAEAWIALISNERF